MENTFQFSSIPPPIMHEQRADFATWGQQLKHQPIIDQQS